MPARPENNATPEAPAAGPDSATLDWVSLDRTNLVKVAEALESPYWAGVDDRQVSSAFVEAVPIAYARRHALAALESPDGQMVLVMADLAAWPQLQILRRRLGVTLRPAFAPREAILRAIDAAYSRLGGQAQQTLAELDSKNAFAEWEGAAAEDLLDVSGRAPVIKLVNLILFEAVKRHVSDVHIQPYQDRLVVRFRIDGVLYDVFTPHKALQEEIISRIKIMGQMNIAERRLAQDGRASVEVGQRVVDLRIATLPTSFGERVVIRLLEKSFRYTLADLGMSGEVLVRFRKVIRQDHGIILVSGPTGSGKSTTLYAALKEINSQERNILTLEDPIEYRLEGVSQTQVNDKKGMTFATGLRSVLRQDPDIIMVGEIRDSDTAHMAIQSALTGHLVFSTLHTNDASGAVARMLDLGVEPYLLASSLLGVLAQRLLRRICPACRETFTPTSEQVAHWGLMTHAEIAGTLQRGRGCPECMNTGYTGRLGLFEMLLVNEPIRELILQRAKASTITTAACENGMVLLRQDGLAKALRGETSMDEVVRVAGLGEF